MESLIVPLTQSPEFGQTLKAFGLPVRCGLVGPERAPEMQWLIQSRRLPLLGQVDLISRGPVLRSETAIEDWLPLCQNRRCTPLLINADDVDTNGLRAAGFWPLITPATIAMLTLGPERGMKAALHQKWRNRLSRAQASKITVTRRPIGRDHWLLRAEQEQARSRGYRSLPPDLVAAYAATNPGKALIWEALHRKTPVAAIAILRHGRMATWQIGVTHPEGRKLNAMNLLLWEAMLWLAAHGHDRLDLGILNTDDAPGLTHFKLGTGAKAHRLGGTWLRQPMLAPLARHLPQRLAA
ncbi:GNAT family N-acetyltransferase [Salipiger pallidus]|nr:GNAT family N-acetyltransferase [Salipiger pallidus]